MNKRVRQKKVKERYQLALNYLVGCCELSEEIILKEVGTEIWEMASNLKEQDADLFPYLGKMSIELMETYQSGWVGEKYDGYIRRYLKRYSDFF